MNWKHLLFGRPSEESRLTPELTDRIRASFDEASRDNEHFPDTIDSRIYHVKLVLEHLGEVGNGRVLDAGCGKGRFARIVQERNPEAEVWGLDISDEMLKFVQPPLHAKQGVLTGLPFPDAHFDGVYATESLEHAVDIPKAVGELCRVLKPGGRLIIIDKNAEHFGRLETPEWERWFSRKELEKLLARDCGKVSSRFISYWEDVEPDGLFLAWLAEK